MEHRGGRRGDWQPGKMRARHISAHTHTPHHLYPLSLSSHTSHHVCHPPLFSPLIIQTLRMLEDFKIPYNEIHFGQPYADVYVDASVACSASRHREGFGLEGRRREERADARDGRREAFQQCTDRGGLCH